MRKNSQFYLIKANKNSVKRLSRWAGVPKTTTKMKVLRVTTLLSHISPGISAWEKLTHATSGNEQNIFTS